METFSSTNAPYHDDISNFAYIRNGNQLVISIHFTKTVLQMNFPCIVEISSEFKAHTWGNPNVCHISSYKATF